MPNEYTPELDASILAALQRKIQEDEARRLAAIRGEATRRGLSGGSFEGRGVGDVMRGSQTAQTDAAVNLAVERARMQREERLAAEQRAYESSEAEKSRTFSAGEAEKTRLFGSSEAERVREYERLEAEKQRAYNAGETEKARAFQAEQSKLGIEAQNRANELERQFNALEAEKQRAYAAGENERARQFEEQQALINRDYQSALADKEARSGLLQAGIGGIASGVGSMLGKGRLGGLFGKGAAGAAGSGAGSAGGAVAGTGGVAQSGGLLGSVGGIGGLAGIGAGLFGGGYLGQKAAGLTGKVTRESKAGSAIGAGIGTLFGGPLGGMAGGAIGGLATKGIQGVAKSAKKLFCFVAGTQIEMSDGSNKKIEDILLGDETAGGTVYSIRTSLTPENTLYNYKGVLVTGSHAVKENNVWKRVKDSKYSVKVCSGPVVVYSLVTSKHRIYVEGLTFADEHETDRYEELSLDESLRALNEEVYMEKIYSAEG